MPRAVAVLAFALTFLVPAPPAAQAATRTVEGIDVSHWQGSIDWRAVGRTKIKFAIAKATEGRTFIDPRYASNRAGARAVGIRFTAYHFANPDLTTNDAIAEADHFVAVAGLRRGDLLPVLDLERTGGLTQSQLIGWTRAWVQRVEARLGVKPMIYASPSFWRNAMGNTTWFASNGNRLWVAHWGVTAPSVPAANWGGRGWTLWQYTSCGRVSGIAGCVDRDRYAGRDLRTITI